MTDLSQPSVRSPKRAEAWARKAFARAQALALGLESSFVFRPGAGAVTAPLYSTQASLKSAMDAVPGPKILQIDGSIAMPVLDTPGWNFNGVTLVSSAGDTLTVAGAFSMTASIWAIKESLGFLSTCTGPIWLPVTSGTGFFPTLFMDENAAVACTVAPAFSIALAQGAAVNFAGLATFDNFGGGAVVDCAGTFDAQAFGFGGPLNNTIAGTGILNYTYDANAPPPPQTIATYNKFPVSVALGENFTCFGAPPTITPGAAAGAGAAILAVADNTDNAGKIILDTGAGPTTGEQVDVVYATPYPAGVVPSVVIARTDPNTVGDFYVTAMTPTGFKIFASVAPTGGAAYSFTYIAIARGLP